MTKPVDLKHIKDLPNNTAGYLMRCPITREDAIAWGEKYKAEKVYYYGKTKVAYIVFQKEK